MMALAEPGDGNGWKTIEEMRAENRATSKRSTIPLVPIHRASSDQENRKAINKSWNEAKARSAYGTVRRLAYIPCPCFYY
jgi:hypothetical protein